MDAGPYLKLSDLTEQFSMYIEVFTFWELGFERASRRARIFGVTLKNHHTHARERTHSYISFNDYTFIRMHVVCLFQCMHFNKSRCRVRVYGVSAEYENTHADAYV